MKLLNRSECALLSTLFIYSFIPAIGGLFRLFELIGGPAIVPENPRALAAPIPIVLHVLGSSIFCLLGAIQFLPGIRRHHPGAHRVLGRVVAAAGILSAVTGLWMTLAFSFPAELQGESLYWVRIVLGILMPGLIVSAIVAIRSRNTITHGACMLRAYAIGQGASTQAFLGIGWLLATGSDATGPLRDALMIFAWLFNMLVSELLISHYLTPVAKRATQPDAGWATRHHSPARP